MRKLSALIKSAAALVASVQIASAEMTADEAYRASSAGEIVLIDIRTPAEWAQTGLPETAIGIDLQSPTFIEDLRAVIERNAETPIALICAGGNRSTFATSELANHGFKDLINIPEGMMGSAAGPGWLKQGLPITRP